MAPTQCSHVLSTAAERKDSTVGTCGNRALCLRISLLWLPPSQQPISFPKSEMTERKRSAARERWGILADSLAAKRAKCSASSNPSLRLLCYSSPDEDGWQSVSLAAKPELSVRIRPLTQALTAATLTGFNNTGNVCIWPSEEVERRRKQ